jgi:hypothetical protein
MLGACSNPRAAAIGLRETDRSRLSVFGAVQTLPNAHVEEEDFIRFEKITGILGTQLIGVAGDACVGILFPCTLPPDDVIR